MDAIAFTAELRSEGVKANILREEGKVPAVLYGQGTEALSLQCDAGEFEKVFRDAGEKNIIDLAIGKDAEKVLVYNVQRDPVTDQIIHIDFYKVNLKEKITTQVPIEFIGVAPAVKEEGGIFVSNREEVEVRCLPIAIPKIFQVDISNLKEYGDSLHISDLVVPEGVEILDEEDITIAQVAAPKMQAEAEASKEESEAAAAEAAMEEGGDTPEATAEGEETEGGEEAEKTEEKKAE